MAANPSPPLVTSHVPDDTSLLVDQLDWRALAVVRHTVAHHHVELALVVLHSQHHRHRLPDFDNTAHLTGIGALPNLHI